MTSRHRAPSPQWWRVDAIRAAKLAGIRTWVVVKVATFVAGLLFYLLLIAVFL